MTVQRPDVYDLLARIRMDLSNAQGKLTDAVKLLRELNLPDGPSSVCPKCGLPFRGPRTLSEHLYVSHDGEVPAHYQAIEAASEPANEETP